MVMIAGLAALLGGGVVFGSNIDRHPQNSASLGSHCLRAI
jgi:hypothetical protein